MNAIFFNGNCGYCDKSNQDAQDSDQNILRRTKNRYMNLVDRSISFQINNKIK